MSRKVNRKKNLQETSSTVIRPVPNRSRRQSTIILRKMLQRPGRPLHKRPGMGARNVGDGHRGRISIGPLPHLQERRKFQQQDHWISDRNNDGGQTLTSFKCPFSTVYSFCSYCSFSKALCYVYLTRPYLEDTRMPSHVRSMKLYDHWGKRRWACQYHRHQGHRRKNTVFAVWHVPVNCEKDVKGIVDFGCGGWGNVKRRQMFESKLKIIYIKGMWFKRMKK